MQMSISLLLEVPHMVVAVVEKLASSFFFFNCMVICIPILPELGNEWKDES